MSLLECSIKETLRLYPPIIVMMRRALKAFEYGGYHIPANSMLLTSPAMAHRIRMVTLLCLDYRIDERMNDATRSTSARPSLETSTNVRLPADHTTASCPNTSIISSARRRSGSMNSESGCPLCRNMRWAVRPSP